MAKITVLDRIKKQDEFKIKQNIFEGLFVFCYDYGSFSTRC